MWGKIAYFILKNRLWLLIILGLLTLCMGYLARNAEITYDYVKVVPANDPDLIIYNDFRATFGDDANIFVIGIKDSSLYELENFNAWRQLGDDILGLEGVSRIISICNLENLVKDTMKNKFRTQPVFPKPPKTQAQLDIGLKTISKMEFYKYQIVNPDNGASLMVVSIDKNVINTKHRVTLIDDIIQISKKFQKQQDIKVHCAGIPYMRSILGGKVADELYYLLFLSLSVTVIFLFYFFRSGWPVVFSILVVCCGVIWSLGIIVLLGYKMTLLTALIPTLIVVIGIPNCIYLLNKYHQEYAKHQNRILALNRIIRKIGMVTLLTNVTTAIGFATFCFTDIAILTEFGVVASLSIMSTYVISLIIIPTSFSFLPNPSSKQLRHLDFKFMESLIALNIRLVNKHRKVIFLIAALIVIISTYGLTKIKTVSFMLDDISDSDNLKTDLRFFEKNFGGMLPFEVEIFVNRKIANARFDLLTKINKIERVLSNHTYFDHPLSVNNFAKFTVQAFYNGNPKHYRIPNKQESAFIARYISNSKQWGNTLKSFVDSSGQRTRISYKIKDIGSHKMDSVLKVIRTKIDFALAKTPYSYAFTGATLIFLKGNTFLIKNLLFSLGLALILIAVIVSLLFYSAKMMLMTLIPNVIPLLVTGGIMGFFNIHLKPSTAIIFSISFGIAVDTAIHLLARYNQEIIQRRTDRVSNAVSASIRDTGMSMISTTVILFFGFIVFTVSDFGGTAALGVLVSITLFFALFTNILLLPSILLGLERRVKLKAIKKSLMDGYDEYFDDHDINVDLLQVSKMEHQETEEDEIKN